MEASSDRFVRAVQKQWETHGSAALSARGISTAADAPVSSIYHHFGSLEQLFVSSQQVSLARAASWISGLLPECTGLTADDSAFPSFFAGIVDEWTGTQRPLAFAWRECQLLAEGNALFRPLSAEWDALWSDFWQQVGKRFALGAGTQVAARVFENENLLHMIRWRRTVDRAALDETANVLGAWLARKPVPATPWRDFARAEALRSVPSLPQRDDTAARIVTAAADLIANSGVSGLTHRAVADRSGLTLGTISHRFTTKSALLQAGFEGLYESNLERLQGGPTPMMAPDGGSVRTTLCDMIQHGASVRGSDELFMAVARDASLSEFGLQLRYLRGRTSFGMLQVLVGDARKVTQTEAALFSSFTTSQIRCFSGAGSVNTQATILAEIENLVSLLS